MYRIVLEAESDGILDGVDMREVEMLILDPKPDEYYELSGDRILETEVNVNKNKENSLINAVREGQVNLTKELITQGADINAQDQHGETALITAAKNGQTLCIDQLLEVGAQLNIIHNKGYTALIHAIINRKVQCAKKIIAAGADVNMGTVPPLICSIKSRSFESANDLIGYGADVNGEDEHKNTALIEAVRCGKNTIVQALFLNGANVNAENTNGDKAIHFAAKRSHQEFKLQQSNIEINKVDKKTSYLESASEFVKTVKMHLTGILSNEVAEGFDQQTIDLEPPEYQKPAFHILKMLLAAGAEIEESVLDLCFKSVVRNYIREHLKKIHPKSNLYVTVKKLRSLPEILQSYLLFDTLLGKNKSPNMSNYVSNLFSLTLQGDKEMVKNLIRNRLDLTPGLRLKSVVRNYIGKHLKQVHPNSDLSDTVKNLQILPKVLQSYLLFQDFDVNAKNAKGMTPLMVAAEKGHVELIEELIQAGAKVNCFNLLTGDTSLIYASEASQTACVSKLLEFRANINMQGKNGDTALISAVRNGYEECSQALIDSGVNLNIQNNNGNTALIAAVHRFQFRCAVQLIKAGVDINLMDNHGNTAIVLAARNGQVDFIKRMITAGANLNHFDEYLQMTPLMTAACQNHAACVKLLIQSGVDLNMQDVNGKTALMTTAESVSSASFMTFMTLLAAGAEVDTGILADIALKFVNNEGKRIQLLIDSLNVMNQVVNGPVMYLKFQIQINSTPNKDCGQLESFSTLLLYDI